jgi:hypothetical protein
LIVLDVSFCGSFFEPEDESRTFFLTAGISSQEG